MRTKLIAFVSVLALLLLGAHSQVDITPGNKISIAQDGPVNLNLSRFLDTNGNGTGTKNAVGNYVDGALEIFYIQPPASTVYKITRLLVNVEDTKGMTGEEYADLGSALTVGVVIRVQGDSGTIVNLTDDLPVKANNQWSRFAYDVVVSNLSSSGLGSANDFVLSRWSFFKSNTVIRLDGDQNERLEVVLNDNLTGIVSHYFLVQGFTERTGT